METGRYMQTNDKYNYIIILYCFVYTCSAFRFKGGIAVNSKAVTDL